MKVVFDGLLQQKSLRLSVFFGDRDEFLVELGVDGGADFNGGAVGHETPLTIILAGPAVQVKIKLDNAR